MAKPATQDLINDPAAGIERLLAIMEALRDPATGCPWDIEQTSASIARYTLEEAHEVVDAIEREAWDELPAELGDMLLQVVFHARMQQEAGRFGFQDVVRAICDKMVARHPHVFGDADGMPPGAWEAMKAAERGDAATLDGVAASLPALTRAVKLQARAARVGFDWPQTEQVLDKMLEESRELVEARDTLGHAELTEEFGDLMFVMANLARHLRIDPEAALRGANAKFMRRFAHIESRLAQTGRRPEDSDLAEMDELWNEAKAIDKAAG